MTNKQYENATKKKKFNKVVDSGKRQQFNTGSQRDTDEGKGKPHLIAGEAIALLTTYINSDRYVCVEEYKNLVNELVKSVHQYATFVSDRSENLDLIYKSMDLLCHVVSEKEEIGYFQCFIRLAQHYENGAKKYDEHNWRKGQPISRYYDSAMRHLYKYLDEMEDEDHASALFWNLVAIIQTKIDITKGLLPKELDDYPTLISEVFKGKIK